MATAATTPHSAAAARPMTREEKKVILASSLGTVFEWYDFYLYGSLATIIGAQFFSAFDVTTRNVFALLAFGLSLREQGWRINYLGADTPVASVVEAARALAPAAVVISGTTSGAFDESATRLREVTLHAPLWIAGAAASGRVARRAHAAHLAGDVVLATETLAAGVE